LKRLFLCWFKPVNEKNQYRVTTLPAKAPQVGALNPFGMTLERREAEPIANASMVNAALDARQFPTAQRL
jgi:hypothetical protein